MPISRVCVDADLTLKLVLSEPDSALAESLWESWKAAQLSIIAPSLWAYEVTSVIHNRLHRGRLAVGTAEKAFDLVHQLTVELLHPDGLHRRAWELARHFGRPAAYDSHYLALAEMTGCPFWTADERLFNAVRSELDWVHWLGDYQPPVASP